MITRLYVNNYRSLVAFEMRFDSMSVFCGANGSGKSSMFDAIQFVCALATGACFLGGLPDTRGRTVSHLEFTNWMQSNTQEFELDILSNNHQFRYLIRPEQSEHREPRIIQETALCDDREIYTRCTKERLQNRKAAGAKHGENESSDLNVFRDSGIHNESDIYSANKSRLAMYYII
ncbi:hypothetical protein FACS189494_12050 [Spirochaetia bacterium]|nr:hypothetical protein FACS189494_12050 [Spirochaetia bacterium]